MFLLVVFVCVTLSPSGNRMTLLAQKCPLGTESPSGFGGGRLDFAGFARIGRVFLSVEGGMVDCVLNREGGMVGNCRLGWGFGGRNCSGRVEWLGG